MKESFKRHAEDGVLPLISMVGSVGRSSTSSSTGNELSEEQNDEIAARLREDLSWVPFG
jgi:hypothetical protein